MSNFTNSEHSPVEWKPPATIDELYNSGATTGNKFASINAPTAGARVQQELESGSAPFQLYRY